MLNIDKNAEDEVLTIVLEGRLDTESSPKLEKELEELEGVSELIFDMGELEYISSAGLRVLLSAQKQMNSQGEMKLTNVNDTIMDIFEITGFTEILTME